MENIKKNENFMFFENRKINLTQFSEYRASRIEPIQTNQNNTKIPKLKRQQVVAYETLFLPNIVKLKVIIQGKTEQKYGKY